MKYISLLRGINVGGHHKIRMADLSALYQRAGCREVRTYIQSGNVIFEADGKNRLALTAKLAAAITAEYGWRVPVELRTRRELGAIIADCPLGAIDLASEGSKAGVVFLAGTPTPDQVATLQPAVTGSEEMVVQGSEIYLRCPDGFGQSKLTSALLERKLGVSATARNWKTVQKLYELSA